MSRITIASQAELTPQVLDMMHQFRRRVFVERLRWNLPMLGGVERDEYDAPDAVYVICRTEDHEIAACARLLPTTSSYMLPELFPQLLDGAPAPQCLTVWELSRFAADVTTTQGRVVRLSPLTLAVLDAVFGFARERGVQRLVLVTSIAIERLLLRTGLDVHRLGTPSRIGGSLTVALCIEVPGVNEKAPGALAH